MNKKTNPFKPEDIHIIEVKLLNLNIYGNDEFNNNPSKPEGMTIQMANDIAFDFENGVTKVQLSFKFDGLDANQKPLGITAEVTYDFFFTIDNFKKYIIKEKTSQKVDIAVAVNVLAIAYSTARGILIEKLQNTYFEYVILPIVDVKKFLLEN